MEKQKETQKIISSVISNTIGKELLQQLKKTEERILANILTKAYINIKAENIRKNLAIHQQKYGSSENIEEAYKICNDLINLTK